MSINEKYNSVKSSNEYNEYVLDCVKEYFMDKKIKINNKFKCSGNGECFDNIPGTYIFYKNKRCSKNCILKKCPNFILCKNYVSQDALDEYYGLCYHCSLAYKPCGKGKGTLKIFDDYNCVKCLEKTVCIEQPFCDHILCLQCFKLAHMKPGNNKCPLVWC
jgi:hypothetical protein